MSATPAKRLRSSAVLVRVGIVGAVAVAVVAVAIGAGTAVTDAPRPTSQHTSVQKPHQLRGVQPAAHPAPPAAPPQALSSSTIAALPEAQYDAVIAGLVPVESVVHAETAYLLVADTAVYGADLVTPVARLSANNFLGDPTVVVPFEIVGAWSRILTPARQQLPSQHEGRAPAQSSGWVPSSALSTPTALLHSIAVSVSTRTLSIISDGTSKTFSVGVGTASTPTPTGVTGYLQARYLDKSQGQNEFPVQLSSLHSSSADEPFGGKDGGLIGLHYERAATGAVSHGCVRLSAEAAQAVNALPLGTLVTIRP